MMLHAALHSRVIHVHLKTSGFAVACEELTAISFKMDGRQNPRVTILFVLYSDLLSPIAVVAC